MMTKTRMTTLIAILSTIISGIVFSGGDMLQAKTVREPLYVAIIWNQHQPCYKDPVSGSYQQPWVRLHGVKDYYQMAAWLKQYPGLHQTFNLTPSLIAQIKDYAQGSSDAFLRLSEIEPEQLSLEDREFILRHFFSVPRVARKGRLVALEQKVAGSETLTPQDYRDIQALFNLAWIDPTLIAGDKGLAALKHQDGNYSAADISYILDSHRKIMRAILPLHKELEAQGSLELITTPFYHPILPLLINSSVALECSPGKPMPETAYTHPEDAAAQVNKALAYHKANFGKAPQGLWPSEQAVSAETVKLLAQQGVQWIVTDETILAKSLNRTLRGKFRTRTSQETSGVYVPGSAGPELLEPEVLYQPYRIESGGKAVTVLFRDEYLSDLIGFEYAKYSGTEAASDLFARLMQVRSQMPSSKPYLLTLALDGENAWEFYPEEKTRFFTALYGALSRSKEIRLVSVSEYLRLHPPVSRLKTLATGSWNMGNLERWIGSPSKNKVWDLLEKVRQDLSAAQDKISRERNLQAWEEFYTAQGSDYPWWLDSQPYEQALPFDQLFRLHLGNVYRALGEEVPAFVQQSILKRP